MTDAAARTIALTHDLRAWLEGPEPTGEPATTDIAVGLANLLAAVGEIQERVQWLLRLELSVPSKADEALTVAAELEAYLFSELRSQLERLEPAWPQLLTRLEKLGPKETEG